MALRYAILHHSGIPEPHFDLLFEAIPGSDLATWRSPVWPITTPTLLTRLKDHRRAYLDYEGELSQRRGRVERIAAGTCTIEIGEDAHWTIRLLTGVRPATLRIARQAGDDWLATVVDAERLNDGA